MKYCTKQNEWFTEHCLICGSVNHIFLDSVEAHAWECWSCFNKWWIDELGKDSLIIAYDIDDDEAEDRLTNCHPSIIFLFGQPI